MKLINKMNYSPQNRIQELISFQNKAYDSYISDIINICQLFKSFLIEITIFYSY